MILRWGSIRFIILAFAFTIEFLISKSEIMQIKLAIPYNHQTVRVLDKFSASITLASCVIPEEAILNQLEVIHLNLNRLIGLVW